MSYRKTALRRSHPRSAFKALAKPDPIVADKAQEEWERGCKWAAVAFALTFGPLISLGIYWGWV